MVVIIVSMTSQVFPQEPFYTGAEYTLLREVINNARAQQLVNIIHELHTANFNHVFQVLRDTASLHAICTAAASDGVQFYYMDPTRTEQWNLFYRLDRKEIYRWKYHPEFAYHYHQDTTLHGVTGREDDATWDVDWPYFNNNVLRFSAQR
jgi:hypothetical protein